MKLSKILKLSEEDAAVSNIASSDIAQFGDKIGSSSVSQRIKLDGRGRKLKHLGKKIELDYTESGPLTSIGISSWPKR